MTASDTRRTVEAICRRHHVQRLDLLGSLARGEAKPDSDVDCCVQLEDLPPSEYSIPFFGLLHDFEDSLNTTVDLLTAGSIHKTSLKSSLQADGICIYGYRDTSSFTNFRETLTP
jgi:predicted nucleotidyltransferase